MRFKISDQSVRMRVDNSIEVPTKDSGVILPTLDVPAEPTDIRLGKEVINSDGEKVAGTMPEHQYVDTYLTLDKPGLQIQEGYHSGCRVTVSCDAPITVTPKAHEAITVSSEKRNFLAEVNVEPATDAYAEGYDEGRAVGATEGYNNGHEEGLVDGKQAEYDRFWDAYQNNGNRTQYNSAFAQLGWTDVTFKPKYNIVLEGSNNTLAFGNSRITDLVKILNDQGVSLITSNCTGFTQLFQGCTTTTVPIIDMRKCTTCSYIFQGCAKLQRIEKLILLETTPIHNTAFSSATALTDITFEGTIGCSVNFNYSPLSVESMKNIIGCLKNYKGTNKELTQTVKFNEACWSALEADSVAPNGTTWAEYVDEVLGWLV